MYKYQGQLELLTPTSIQGELILNVKRSSRGNPNFKSKWATKTKVVRLPVQWADRAIAQCREWENGVAQPTTAPKRIQEIDPANLHLDPKRFQYKIGHSVSGSTGSLSGVRVWDENLSGVILVWVDPLDGLVYVVNGHNRVNLAKALGVNSLCCRFINAKSAIDARFIGAIANIAEGRGSAIDAGKLFRDKNISKEQLERSGICLKEKMAKDGLALSRLPGYMFDRIITGDLDLSVAIAIGNAGLDHDQQSQLLKLIEQSSRSVTLEMIGELADTVRNSQSNSVTQFTLFGLETFNQSTALYRAEVQSAIKRQLRKEKRLFSTVGNRRNASQLEKGNNHIDCDSSQQISSKAEQALRVFDLLKNQSGPISDAISNCVTQLLDGKSKANAIAECLDRVCRVIELGAA